jgi:hypothetical protein
MASSTITPIKGEKLKRLYSELVIATATAAESLRIHGMDSRQFAEADAATGKIVKQIKELLGIAGSHWMEV